MCFSFLLMKNIHSQKMDLSVYTGEWELIDSDDAKATSDEYKTMFNLELHHNATMNKYVGTIWNVANDFSFKPKTISECRVDKFFLEPNGNGFVYNSQQNNEKYTLIKDKDSPVYKSEFRGEQVTLSFVDETVVKLLYGEKMYYLMRYKVQDLIYDTKESNSQIIAEVFKQMKPYLKYIYIELACVAAIFIYMARKSDNSRVPVKSEKQSSDSSDSSDVKSKPEASEITDRRHRPGTNVEKTSKPTNKKTD